MTSEALALLGGNLALIALLVVALSGLLYSNLRQRVVLPMSPSFDSLQTAYRELSQEMGEMRDKHEAELGDMKAQQATDHQAIRQLRAEVLRIDTELQRWRVAFAALVSEFAARTGELPTTQPPEAQPAPVQIPAPSAAQLAALIAELFNIEEIDSLAFELSLSANVTGDTIEARARSLVDAARRRRKTDALVALCRRERPEGGF